MRCAGPGNVRSRDGNRCTREWAYARGRAMEGISLARGPGVRVKPESKVDLRSAQRVDWEVALSRSTRGSSRDRPPLLSRLRPGQARRVRTVVGRRVWVWTEPSQKAFPVAGRRARGGRNRGLACVRPECND